MRKPFFFNNFFILFLLADVMWQAHHNYYCVGKNANTGSRLSHYHECVFMINSNFTVLVFLFWLFCAIFFHSIRCTWLPHNGSVQCKHVTWTNKYNRGICWRSAKSHRCRTPCSMDWSAETPFVFSQGKILREKNSWNYVMLPTFDTITEVCNCYY